MGYDVWDIRQDNTLKFPQVIRYLTTDSAQEGVGQSQIVAYILKLAGRFEIELYSFEKYKPSDRVYEQLSPIRWHPIKFGRRGWFGAFIRLIHLYRAASGANFVHARSDIPFMAAWLARVPHIVWDCRALMPYQKTVDKTGLRRYLLFNFLSFFQYIAATRSSHIIVITNHAKDYLMQKYGLPAEKFSVISTCVDMEIFEVKKSKIHKTINILIPGTLNDLYDFNAINRIIRAFREITPTHVTVALPLNSTENYRKLDTDIVLKLSHSELASNIHKYDLGIAIIRENIGLALKSIAPTKIAEFLAAGIPVVVNQNLGDVGKFIYKVLPSFSLRNLQSLDMNYCVRLMIADLNDREVANSCRLLAEQHFSLKIAVLRIEQIYFKLLSR
jgi:glycosyltransferase involved in cell wall biosynthesis